MTLKSSPSWFFCNFRVIRSKIDLPTRKLIHKVSLYSFSGYQTAENRVPKTKSRWGLDATYPGAFSTILVRDNRLLVPSGIKWTGDYELDGFGINDDVIILKHNELLSAGTELQVWFGADYLDVFEFRSEGTHCINVDISCIV